MGREPLEMEGEEAEGEAAGELPRLFCCRRLCAFSRSPGNGAAPFDCNRQKLDLKKEVNIGPFVYGCIEEQNPPLSHKLYHINTDVEKLACTWFDEICYCCS